MNKPKPLTDSPRYRDFIAERDKGFEPVLGRYLTAIDRIVDALKNRAHEVARHISTEAQGVELQKHNRQTFQRRIEPWFELAITRTTMLLNDLRRTSYGLSYVSQAEAIGRALGKRTKFTLHAAALEKHINRPMTFGGSLHARTDLAYRRLMNDVVEAFHTSQVMESPLGETLARIDRAFPAQRKLKRIHKLIAPMREASIFDDEDDEDEKYEGFSFGPLDKDEWDKIVEDYKSNEIPFGRAPEDKIFTGGKTSEGEDEFVYQWQVEQEATDDFVSSVRAGENEAARENGVTDFLWIAIVDSKTDECCYWRDGLTTAEIETQLEGDHSDDECDAVTVPAHFNCRCRMAPMTDDLPETPPTDFGSFDDWLKSKE